MPRKGRASADGTPEETGQPLLERIQQQLYHHVGEAVASVSHLERVWSQSEMTRRIVRYIYKSVSNADLLIQPWRDCVKNLVGNAMSSFTAACQEKDWFFEISLTSAFVSVAWELLQQSQHPPSIRRLQKQVQLEYEQKLDRIVNAKALWEASKNSFPDNNVFSKVYTALCKTFDTALDLSLIHISEPTRPY